ncbi:TIGR04222 domain-containing membrane protein [Actinacidiphila bryophytorum]|uniref:TIGR04222 domain-containing membrane protein n=1 Tax=Actinacidiphila bryophytorum TaxID=1436133 RepID=UPI002176C51F|nr:TIGR04222 domain-containing membrane protein [Actinacidiphila bryophytorum]UWE10926.1 TIGR04222 domain-containing membrane protein [Actinacidiphila bryophytorum]
MSQPWGMSGPEFLGVYAAAFAVAGIAAALLKAGFRKRRDTDPASGTGPADVYTLAVVGGGTARVVDTAVQALVETGRLRAGRDHRISPAGAPVAHEPVQQAVLGCFDSPAGITLSTARTRAAASGPVQQVAQDAVRRGLLFGAGHRKAALTSALPLAAVFCVGVARLVNGVHLGRPVGLLVMALLFSGGITVAVAVHAPRRTLAGDRLLERARQGRVPDPRLFGSYGIASYAPSGGDDMLVPAAVLGVAVLGAAGVADPDLRQALYGGMSGSGSGSTDSGSGDSGGGGCGGGGCGGGCGGCGG